MGGKSDELVTVCDDPSRKSGKDASIGKEY